MEFATVVVRALSRIFHGRIEAECHLRKVALAVIEPDYRPGRKFGLHVEGISIEIAGFLLPVEHFVRLRHSRHFFDQANAFLRHRLPVVPVIRAGG